MISNSVEKILPSLLGSEVSVFFFFFFFFMSHKTLKGVILCQNVQKVHISDCSDQQKGRGPRSIWTKRAMCVLILWLLPCYRKKKKKNQKTIVFNYKVILIRSWIGIKTGSLMKMIASHRFKETLFYCVYLMSRH